MGTGRTNSLRALRRAVNDATPKRRAKNVRTGVVAVTLRMDPFSASGAAVTVTPLTPFANPFFAASACAAVTAPPTLPGRYTTPASAAASAARWIRIMFSSYQPISATSPMKPKSAVSMSATIARVCPRSSARSARRIFRHHRALRDHVLVEDRHEEAEWRARAIGVADGHADRVGPADVVPHAGQPGLAL